MLFGGDKPGRSLAQGLTELIAMRLIRCLSLWSVLLLSGAASGQNTALPARDASTVKVTLERWRTAIQSGNGERAYGLLDRKTIAFYDDCRKDAVTIKKADLALRDYLTRLTILWLRCEFTRADLEKKTDKDVIVTGVKKGWIGGSFAGQIVVQYVGLDKDGLAFVTLRQSPKTPAFYFVKEEGLWKLALAQTFDLANKGFTQLHAKSELTAEDFLAKIIEDGNRSRAKVDRKIFEGPLDELPKPPAKK